MTDTFETQPPGIDRASAPGLVSIIRGLQRQAQDGLNVVQAERDELIQRDAKLYMFVCDTYETNIIQFGPRADALLHGFYFGYRAARLFVEGQGLTLPDEPNLEGMVDVLDLTPQDPGLDDHYCHAAWFQSVFANYPELVELVISFKTHEAQDGAGFAFGLYRETLLPLL